MDGDTRTDDDLGDEHDGDSEEERERYRELLEELRTVIPGMTVVFGFLLTTPFSQRFAALDATGRRVFAAALLGTAVAALILWAPAAFHRLSAPGSRAVRLRISIVLQVVGMTLLLLSISSAIFVVTRFIFKDTAVGVGFGLTALVLGALLWYALPMLTWDRRARSRA